MPTFADRTPSMFAVLLVEDSTGYVLDDDLSVCTTGRAPCFEFEKETAALSFAEEVAGKFDNVEAAVFSPDGTQIHVAGRPVYRRKNR